MLRDTITFGTWLSNHPEDHDAKWCRELYPWMAFANIEYNERCLGSRQDIKWAGQTFQATLENAFVGLNDRPNFLIHLETSATSNRQQWMHRHWNDTFQLVASPEGIFITLFTKKRDPSKIVLQRFMNGNLSQVEQLRSLPVSGLLFRSLISYLAEDIFGEMVSFANVPPLRPIGGNPQREPDKRRADGFEPFLSQGNDLWIVYSFSEEKAHRLGLRLQGSSKLLIVVYCQPTFTRHHRCSDENVRVISLAEFVSMGSETVREKYVLQAQFILSNLRTGEKLTAGMNAAGSAKALLDEQAPPREIYTSELREAKAGLERVIVNLADAAYVLASANLLNAAMNKKLGLYKGSQKLSKEVYSFKALFARRLEQIIG